MVSVQTEGAAANLVSGFRHVGAVLFSFQQLEEILRSGLQLLGLRLLAWVVWEDLCEELTVIRLLS